MGFNPLKILTFPFRMIFKGLKGAFKVLGEGAEVIGEFVVKEFPEDFLNSLLGKVVDLEFTGLSGKDKRKKFLEFAEKEAKNLGIRWSENVARAILELLVARISKKGKD